MVEAVKELGNVKAGLAKVAEKLAFSRAGYTIPTIIAVSKNHDKSKIIPLLKAGHRVFGENRVQEAIDKWPELKNSYPDIELHLIGPLQSNKTKEAVKLFDVIETVDREKIARSIADEIKKTGRNIKLFIQVNTGEEEQKAGIAPKDADRFIKFCIKELELPVKGLMCIPPVDEESAMHFSLLKKIAGRNNLKELSMGMSADYETAAALGATYVRIGTAIFGERK